MDKSTKILIGCFLAAGLAGLILLVVGGAGMYLLYSHIAPAFAPGEFPAVEPGVHAGEGFFVQSLVFHDQRLGRLTDIIIQVSDGGSEPELGIVGAQGALFLDNDFNETSFVGFGRGFVHVEFLDVENDGVWEFINRGSWGSDTALIGSEGQVRWSYGGMPGVNDMCAGDVDGDGDLEFVVGFNGGGGVHLVDADGQRI